MNITTDIKMKTQRNQKRNRILPRIAACLLAGAGGMWHPSGARAADAAAETVTMSATVAAPAAVAAAVATADATADATGQQQQGEPSDVLAALQKLATSIRDKIGASEAEPSEQDYVLELAAFNAIIASNKNAKPDDLAQVLAVKASLYVQAFNDYDNAAQTVMQIQADYPQTETGSHAGEMLSDLRQMQAKYLAQVALQTGRAFPDFAAKSLEGRDVALAQFKGRVVLVDFWATWCPPCVAELPNLKAAYEKYHDKGFEIVGISLDQSEATLRNFLTARAIPWTQIFDGKGWESSLAQKYGVDVIPTMYLLDADGKIAGSNLGGMSLEEDLEKLLGSKASQPSQASQPVQPNQPSQANQPNQPSQADQPGQRK